MSDKTVEKIYDELCAPFGADEIEWRIQSSGTKNNNIWAKCLAYVTARAIMDRLDSVCGFNGWKNEFSELSNGATLCGISIRFGGEWITKWNGSGDSNMEKEKGAISGAEKRAAVEWGIGRYLYNLKIGWADVKPGGKLNTKIEGQYRDWNPPPLPAWALPTITNERRAELDALLTDAKDKDWLTVLWKSMANAEQNVYLEKFSKRKGELS